MSRVWLLGALAAAIVGGSAARAQDTAIGSRLSPRPDVGVTGRDGALESLRYAQCLINKRAPAARRLLAASTMDEFLRLRAGISRELTCSNLVGTTDAQIGQSVAMSLDVYRGNLATALLAADPAAPMPALPLQARYSSPWNAVSGRDIAVDEMAACVAATAPEGISLLLSTLPDSDREKQAMRSLVPAFGPCLAANARLTANRMSIRAALAEAAYHRRFDPPVEVAGGGAKQP